MATTAKTMLMILSFLIFSLNTIVSNKKFVQIESGGPNTDEKSKSTLPTIINDTRVTKLTLNENPDIIAKYKSAAGTLIA